VSGPFQSHEAPQFEPVLDELRGVLIDFIAYFNRILAKPVKWTFTGKARAG
jgi:hypothetical protein